ncbi:MAG: alpha/beta hydrolase [Gammaproteobacteria bacterium]
MAVLPSAGTQTIGYARYGRKGGLPAMYFHGLPGSCSEAQLMAQACELLGVDLVAPDRFGFGQSTGIPGNRYLAWVETVARLADAVGFEQFHVLAASGGAPYGLACASLLPERILSTRICCGLGSLHISELRNSMGSLVRLLLYLAGQQPRLLRYSVGGLVSLAARYCSRHAIRLVALVNGEPDKSALTDKAVLEIMAANLRRAFAQGAKGAVEDLQAAWQPWPFALERIRNLQCWHGDRDSLVPLAHGQWLVEQVPDSVFHVVPGEGHFSLPINHFATIVASLFDGAE